MEDGELVTLPTTRDGAMWTRTADGFQSAVSDVALSCAPAERQGPGMLGEQTNSPVKLTFPSSGKKVSAEGGICPTDIGGTYTAFGGPFELPSKYYATMKDTGYCVVEALIVPEVLEHLAGVFARVEAERPESGEARANPGSGNFWMMDMMKEDPMMTRMCANPVMLTIMREYFGRDDMGFGHTPIVNTMKPIEQAPDLKPGGGWHSCDCTSPPLHCSRSPSEPAPFAAGIFRTTATCSRRTSRSASSATSASTSSARTTCAANLASSAASLCVLV